MSTTITLTGRLADITSAPLDEVTRVQVKAPSYRPGPGVELTTSSPTTLDVGGDGAITVNVVEGLGWLYIEGPGWSDTVRFVAAEGMSTLWEAVVNAMPIVIEAKRLLTQLGEVYEYNRAEIVALARENVDTLNTLGLRYSNDFAVFKSEFESLETRLNEAYISSEAGQALPPYLTQAGLETATTSAIHSLAPAITVGPYGQYQTSSDWDGSQGTDDWAVIQSAIDACPIGGTVHLDFRGRDTFSSETLLITKPIKVTSGTTTDHAGRLWFPIDKTGIVIQAPAVGGVRPSNVVLENIYIRGPVPTTYAPSDTEGVGIHVKDGRVHFRDVIVQFMSGHGLYIQAGRQHDHYGDGRSGKGGNVTKSQFDNLRVANVWGDGIKLHGTDTQACLFVKPDVVGCKGWGINVDTANINSFIMPHFDQQSSEKGMIRDCANSNDYGFIYAETGSNPEIGGLILLAKDTERESINAKFEVASYAGSVTIVDNTTSRSAIFYDRRNRTYRRSLGVTSMDTNHSFQFDSGATSTSAFSLRYFPGATSPYVGGGNVTILDHNLATDLTTFRRRVKMQDQLRLGVVNPPTVARPNPANAGAGAIMFDSSIGKIIVSNGSAWTDGVGNPL